MAHHRVQIVLGAHPSDAIVKVNGETIYCDEIKVSANAREETIVTMTFPVIDREDRIVVEGILDFGDVDPKEFTSEAIQRRLRELER